MRLLTLIFLVVSLTLCGKADAQNHPVQAVSPANWAAFEQLFLKGQCQALFPVGYIYDLSQQKWLDYQEAVALVPEAEVMLSQQQCDISATKEQLATQLNLTWLSEQGLALLFFDYPEQVFEAFDKHDPEQAAKYEQRLSALSSLQSIMRYRISAPLRGLRTQK